MTMDIPENITGGVANNSMRSDLECTYGTHAGKIVKMFSLSVILMMSLFGNLLVICVVCRNRNLRRTINFFILNIAVSDVVIPVAVIPMTLANLARENTAWMLHGGFGVFTCKLVLFLADVSPAVSIISLIFMTVDRFLAVVFPLRVTLMNAKRRYVLIALSWIISLGFFSPYLYAIELLPFNGEQFCILNWSHSVEDHIRTQKAFSTVISIYFLVIPFVIITVLYAVILVKTKTPEFIRSKYSTAARARQKKRAKRLTCMAFLIVFIFGICWGPYQIILFLQIFVWEWKAPTFCGWQSVIFTAQFLSYTNAAINPLIYFGFIKNFRRGLVNQFTTRKATVESRRIKLNSETMLCSIQNQTVRKTASPGASPETETPL